MASAGLPGLRVQAPAVSISPGFRRSAWRLDVPPASPVPHIATHQRSDQAMRRVSAAGRVGVTGGGLPFRLREPFHVVGVISGPWPLLRVRRPPYAPLMTELGERRLGDHRPVTLRMAGRQDVAAIARLFAELSPESFRSRFHSSWAAPDLLSRLASVDLPGTVCVVAATASDGERLAAEARYVPMGDGVAELGLTVLDEYQGSGLGRLLLDLLVVRARDSGVRRLRAVVSLANAPMLRLLEPYGWALAQPTDLSVACLEISAIGGMPGWPAQVTGRRVLVEQRSLFDTERVAALRRAGDDVRLCAGPRAGRGRACPLLVAGHCRLAEEADLIVPLLPPGDEDSARILQAHRARWPGRLGS